MRISDWSSDVCSSDLVGDKPADDLACAEAEIEQHDNPKRTPVGWVLFRPRAISSAAAAACFIRICHVLLLQPPVTVEASISANGSRYIDRKSTRLNSSH